MNCQSCGLPRESIVHDENEIGRVSWAHDFAILTPEEIAAFEDAVWYRAVDQHLRRIGAMSAAPEGEV